LFIDPSNAQTHKVRDDLDGMAAAKVQDFFVFELWEDYLGRTVGDLSVDKQKSAEFFKTHDKDEWETKRKQARELWKQLRHVSGELAREVDVYNYLGIYDQEVWTDPMSHEE